MIKYLLKDIIFLSDLSEEKASFLDKDDYQDMNSLIDKSGEIFKYNSRSFLIVSFLHFRTQCMSVSQPIFYLVCSF